MPRDRRAPLERWVEFVQGGQVKGREVVTIVPRESIDKVQKDSPPRANGSKVELLKGGDYYRVWINRGGNHFSDSPSGRLTAPRRSGGLGV